MGKFSIPTIPVIVMIGQSNEGGYNDDSANATITSESNGYIFYKPDWTSTNNGTWQTPIATGVNNAQYTRIGTYNDIGIELKLANLMYAYNGLKHRFIKLTYGGAEITKMVGETDLNPDSVGEYFDIATSYTYKNAIEQLAGSGKVVVKAITFHQGEAEGAISEAVANAYYTVGTVDFNNPLPYFFQELRLFHKTLATAKIVITRVYTTSGGYPYTSNVAARQLAYTTANPSIAFIDMDNDVVFSDAGVHWNAVTQELKAINIYNIIKDL
jgi:hypothetical protein